MTLMKNKMILSTIKITLITHGKQNKKNMLLIEM